jgi:hypothetical protein
MFALTPDNLAVCDMAKSFAEEPIAPRALEWDGDEHFHGCVARSGGARHGKHARGMAAAAAA